MAVDRETLPITQKILVDWAGPAVFRDGQTLYEKGYVLDAVYDPPYIRGSLLWGNRQFKASLRVMPDGTAENYCPCRDSTERGIICAHAIALGLNLIRRVADPQREIRRQEEVRRAARLNRLDQSGYLRRIPADAPGATPGRLRVTLGREWQQGCRASRIPLVCEMEYGGRRDHLDVVPRTIPFSLSKKDEAILFVLEDIAEGPPTGHLAVSLRDFINLLQLHAGLHLWEEDRVDPVPVNPAKLTSFLRMDLDRENGELILFVHTEVPFMKAGEFPRYLVAGNEGWVFGGNQFWGLETILPEPLWPVYEEPVVIARSAVPHFLQMELPALSRHLRIETDISLDQFTIEPGAPRFRLVVKGSPASLAATLGAVYGDHVCCAGRKGSPTQFAIPEPSDLFRYSVRNPEAEGRALAQLGRCGFRGETGDTLSRLVGCREVLNFLGSHLPELRRMGWKVELDGKIAPHMESLAFATPVVNIVDTPGENWFEVGFRFETGGGDRLADADVLRAIRKGDSFCEKDDRVYLIDGGAVNSLMTVFRDCASTEGSRPGTFRMANVYAAYVKSALDALDGIDVEAPPPWIARTESYNRTASVAAVTLPAELEEILRPYQKEGVNWLRFLEANGFCGILADEMGLGKTLQALAWLQLERSLPAARGKPALIVCPTSLVENWMEEAHRFVPHLKALSVTGPDRHAKWSELAAADLVVTSYALMRRDVEQHLKHEFSVIVLDEAQHIKNRSTQNAITAKQLRGFNRVVLTGTPIENSVSDLWSIMDFLMPSYLGSDNVFRSEYQSPIAEGGMEGEEAQVRLRRKLHPFLLRRLKSEVAKDLPAKIERVATCTLSPDQAVVYREYLESSRRRLIDLVAAQGFDRSRMEVLKTLLRLRQVCCHLGLLKQPELEAGNPSAKMDLFFELLDEALDGKHRVLVFSQFVSMLTILRKELERRELTYCYLDGSTEGRQAIVREFNTNPRIPVFLISLKAGGTGLNLTGADTVIHFDPWWNPAVEDQATDRAHRIGQKRVVYAIKMITRGTVEEKVLAMQQRKKSIIDATIVSDRDVAKSLTWDEIREILE